MPRRTDISPVVDGVLRLVALGGLTATALLAPNAIQLLDKPAQKIFKQLDERARLREMRRIYSYVKSQGLLTEDYEHGLVITSKARKRLEKQDLDSLAISPMSAWDYKWRIIFYDIPEKQKLGRDSLTRKLRELGCYQLQRSVWIHPYPCKDVIEIIAGNHKIEKYITYIETTYVSNQQKLFSRFPTLVK